jgi:hypothetical protein
MFRDRPIGLSASTDNIALLGATDLTHRYGIEGVWLGLSQSVPLTETFSILGSAWYLIPESGGSQESVETYNNNPALGRIWSTQNEWWYVDGLLAISTRGGGALLAGLRYDYFTTKFRDPRLPSGVLSLGSDQADLISYNVIPLVGLQWSCQSTVSNLTVRAVGIPTLAGSVKYLQPFAGFSSIEARGNWKNGYFFELFGEANYAFLGKNSRAGIFVRYNAAHGDVDLDIDAQTIGVLVANETFHTGFTRNTWTLGANLSLDFSMPWN